MNPERLPKYLHEVLSLYARGFSCVYISRRFKCCDVTVRKFLLKHGIALRSASEQRKLCYANGEQIPKCRGMKWKQRPDHKTGAPRGEKNNFWRGGITPQHLKIRGSPEYRKWREAVFERDGFRCVACGAKSGNGARVILHADHILPFSLHPEARLRLENGRTLCRPCHKKTPTYGLTASAIKRSSRRSVNQPTLQDV